MTQLLKSEAGVIRQLQIHLNVLKVYIPSKRNYDRLIQAKQPKESSNIANHGGINQDKQSGAQREQAGLQQLEDAIPWHFPNYPLVPRVYDIICNIFFSYFFFKFIFAAQFGQLGRFFYMAFVDDSPQVRQLDDNCFTFGRIVVHYELGVEVLGAVIALLFIFWRSLQMALNRPHLLDSILFIMQPKDQIERFIRKLNSANIKHDHHHHHHHHHRRHHERPAKCLGLSEYERFLMVIMCYRVTYANECSSNGDYPRVCYRLRPNRTMEAREKLVERLGDLTIKLVGLFITLGICIFTIQIYVILFNQFRYLNVYPGCDPELANLHSQGKLTRWWSSPPMWRSHYRAIVYFDILESILIWWEGGWVLVSATVVATFLNQDLVTHWQFVNEKIRRLMITTRHIHYSSDSHQTHYCDDDSMIDIMLTPPPSPSPVVAAASIHGRWSAEYLATERQLEHEIYDLQAEMRNFFHQIKRVDLLMSDALTFGILIWLASFGLLSFQSADLYSTQKNAEFALVSFGILLSAFFGFSLTSLVLLGLQRRLRASYADICSLMAYDRSPNKRRFMQILDFYTTKNRTCYTLLQQYPYSTTTYLSITGWSVTGFLLLDSMYRRH